MDLQNFKLVLKTSDLTLNSTNCNALRSQYTFKNISLRKVVGDEAFEKYQLFNLSLATIATAVCGNIGTDLNNGLVSIRLSGLAFKNQCYNQVSSNNSNTSILTTAKFENGKVFQDILSSSFVTFGKQDTIDLTFDYLRIVDDEKPIPSVAYPNVVYKFDIFGIEEDKIGVFPHNSQVAKMVLKTSDAIVTNALNPNQTALIQSEVQKEIYTFNAALQQYVNLPPVTLDDKGLSISLWTKVASNGYGNVLFEMNDGTTNNLINIQQHSSGMLRLQSQVNGGLNLYSEFIPSGTLKLNVWYHILITVSSSDVFKIYVNGIKVVEYYGDFTKVKYINHRLGGPSINNPTIYFNGTIAFYRVWNSVLEQDAVDKIYAIKPVDNSITSQIQFTTDIANKQLDINGLISNTVDIGSFTSGTDFISYSVWIKPLSYASPSIVQHIFASGTTPNILSFLIYNNTIQIFNNTTFLNTNYSPPLNTWTHLSVVYTKSLNNVKFYVNGVLNSTLLKTFPDSLSRSVKVGGLGSDNFSGSLYNMRFFNYELSAGEISTLYELTFQYINNPINALSTLSTNSLYESLINSSYNDLYPANFYSIVRNELNFRDINLRTMLGDMYDRFDTFNLELDNLTTNDVWNNSSEGQTSYAVQMEGLPWLNQGYDAATGNSNQALTVAYHKLNPTSTTINHLNRSYYTFSKYQEQANLKIQFRKVEKEYYGKLPYEPFGDTRLKNKQLTINTTTPYVLTPIIVSNSICSLNFWFKRDSNGGDGYGEFIVIRNETEGFMFLITSNRFYVRVFINNGGTYSGDITTQTLFTPNVWNHYAFVLNGTSLKVYVNNIITINNTLTFTLPNFTSISNRTYIQKDDKTYQYYYDVRFYDYPLTTSDIATLYNNKPDATHNIDDRLEVIPNSQFQFNIYGVKESKKEEL